MAADALSRELRILVASFGDSGRGGVWRERLGSEYAAFAECLIDVLSEGVGLRFDELDGSHIEDALVRHFPARMVGNENWAPDLPDLLEEFLTFAAQECGVAKTWEWVHAVNETRDDYSRSLNDPGRPRVAPQKTAPDRRPGRKIGRNEPCPCGSGKKYKACCLT